MEERTLQSSVALEGATIRAPSTGVVTRLGRLIVRKPLGAIAAIMLILLWLMAAFAPLIAPFAADEVFAGPRLAGPSATFWFGTDEVGRDVFSRLVYGARLSLTVSLAATTIGITIGTVLGVVSGYFLGWFDLLWQRVIDAFQAMPALVLLMVIAYVLGPKLPLVALALAVLTVPVVSRVIRASTIAVRTNAYIEASHVIGAGSPRIIIRHILPNVAPTVIVLAAISLGSNILLQSALSFLGLVSSQTPDWGGMLNLGARRYMEVQPWLAIAPGLAISITVLAYNLLGDALRDILDPRLRGTT
ncbi:MAG: ABC transporter permease [Dehalococcoidia bacterium]